MRNKIEVCEVTSHPSEGTAQKERIAWEYTEGGFIQESVMSEVRMVRDKDGRMRKALIVSRANFQGRWLE